MTEWLSLQITRVGKFINRTQKYNSFKYFKSKTKLQAELHCLLSMSSGQNLGSAWTLSSPGHPFLPPESSHFHHLCCCVPSLSLHTSCQDYCSHLLTDLLAPSLDPGKTWVRANYPLLKALQGLLSPLKENPNPWWLKKVLVFLLFLWPHFLPSFLLIRLLQPYRSSCHSSNMSSTRCLRAFVLVGRFSWNVLLPVQLDQLPHLLQVSSQTWPSNWALHEHSINIIISLLVLLTPFPDVSFFMACNISWDNR